MYLDFCRIGLDTASWRCRSFHAVQWQGASMVVNQAASSSCDSIQRNRQRYLRVSGNAAEKKVQSISTLLTTNRHHRDLAICHQRYSNTVTARIQIHHFLVEIPLWMVVTQVIKLSTFSNIPDNIRCRFPRAVSANRCCHWPGCHEGGYGQCQQLQTNPSRVWITEVEKTSNLVSGSLGTVKSKTKKEESTLNKQKGLSLVDSSLVLL